MVPPVVLVQAVADLVVQDLVAVDLAALLGGKAKTEYITDIGSDLERIIYFTLKIPFAFLSEYLDVYCGMQCENNDINIPNFLMFININPFRLDDALNSVELLMALLSEALADRVCTRP